MSVVDRALCFIEIGEVLEGSTRSVKRIGQAEGRDTFALHNWGCAPYVVLELLASSQEAIYRRTLYVVVAVYAVAG
jgi:hypothetical protein